MAPLLPLAVQNLQEVGFRRRAPASVSGVKVDEDLQLPNGSQLSHTKTTDKSQLLLTRIQVLWATVKRHPGTVILPLLVLALIVGLGVYGVLAGKALDTRQAKNSAEQTARLTLASSAQILETAYQPLVALRERVLGDPRWPPFYAGWNETAVRLLSSINRTDGVVALEAAPYGVISAVYPSLLNPSLGLDLLASFHAGTVARMAWGQQAMAGPRPISQGDLTMLASLPVFVPTDWSNPSVPDPAWQLPQSGGICDVPQCSANGTHYWGIFYAVVLIQPLLESPASGLPALRDDGWKCVLRRAQPTNTTDPDVLFAANGDPEDPVSATLNLGPGGYGPDTDLILELLLSPGGGWAGKWWIGAVSAVVVGGLLVAGLLFLALTSYATRQDLIRAMLPERVIRTLAKGNTYMESFQGISILFADIAQYTEISSQSAPMELVQMLNSIYSAFDNMCDRYALFKVETIGDAYVVAGGCPDRCEPEDAAARVAYLALDMVAYVEQLAPFNGHKINIRVGIFSGNVTAAVVGTRMPHMSLVGDAMNSAARMQTNGKAMCIHIGHTTAELLLDHPDFILESRGRLPIKGKGEMQTFFLKAAPGRSLFSVAGSASSRVPSRSARQSLSGGFRSGSLGQVLIQVLPASLNTPPSSMSQITRMSRPTASRSILDPDVLAQLPRSPSLEERPQGHSSGTWAPPACAPSSSHSLDLPTPPPLLGGGRAATATLQPSQPSSASQTEVQIRDETGG